MRPSSPAIALQGAFPAGRPTGPRVAAAAAGGAIQRSPDGFATRLPDATLARRGAGRRLPDEVRSTMEHLLGADFGDVRVHVGHEASSIGALAFAHGSDLFFAPGQYNPHTAHGRRLLGHELTHVVQQRSGRVRNPFGSGVAVVQDPGLEAEAERFGMMAAQAMPNPAAAASGSIRTGAPPGAPPGGAAHHAQPRSTAPTSPRALAPHVQAAVGRSAAQARPARHGEARGGAPDDGYRLIVGSYMHRGPEARDLPAELAGHTFVAVESPGGRRQAFGFSPRGYSLQAARETVGSLRQGAPGHVHADDRAFAQRDVRTRSFPVSEVQARSALAKVDEYRNRHYSFSLQRRQCATFALDVARAAGVDPFPGTTVKRPGDVHRQL